MDDLKLQKMAEVLIWGLKTARGSNTALVDKSRNIWKKAKYEKGDIVRVIYEDHPLAVKLAEYLQVMVLEQGWNPVVRGTGTDKMQHNFFEYASPEQITHIAPWEKLYQKSLNGDIVVMADGDLFAMEDIDPEKMVEMSRSRKFIRRIKQTREADGMYGWTLCALPTLSNANQAKMSVEAYTEEVIRVCYLDEVNPASKWEELRYNAEEIKRWLNAMEIKDIRIESDNMDVTFGLGERRKWCGFTGHNVPSFEIFTSPDNRLATGKFYAGVASYRMGRYIKGVTMNFNKGKIVSAHAEDGDEFLQAQLNADEGSRRCGEISMTDKTFSKVQHFMASTLYDENYAGDDGNFHMAIGSGFPDAYKGNDYNKIKKQLGFNDSAIHWDFISWEPRTVTAILMTGKKRLIFEGGKFTY